MKKDHKEKIGVFICYCGGNISDYVEVEKVAKVVENEPGVQLVKTTMFTCSDSAQVEIIEKIIENDLDGMVVASCSPKLHLLTFRDVAKRAGLNQYNYVHANIREQCSWAHSDRTDDATDKAVRIIRAAISKVRMSQSLQPIEIEAKNVAAVIGAGISGMRSAIELADQGSQVYLIEKDHFVGGRTAQWGHLFPTNEEGKNLVERLYKQIKERDDITLFTGAEVESLNGNIGNFELGVKITPRYVFGKCDDDFLDQVLKACPLEVEDEFNFGLTKRKAIYKNYREAYPESPVIDMELCNKCGACQKICDGKIDLDQEVEHITFNAGAILLNTGFDPYEPEEGEFGYKTVDNVITLQQFRRLLDMSNGTLEYKGKKIRDIAYIYCVGSRQPDGDNKHCSRYCCTSAIQSALNVKNKYPEVRNFHITRGIRTYGKQETCFTDSSRQGDIYLQFFEGAFPEVEKRGEQTKITVQDALTQNENIEVSADLVVLVTGMVQRKDQSVAEILKVPIGSDKFYNEVHTKLRPVETVIDGVFIAGACQSPKNVRGTMASTLAASAKANSLINSGKIELEPIIATVDTDLCEWCGKCDELCSYNAFEKVEADGKTVAKVNKALCKGCGACTPVCPSDAISIVGYSNEEIEGMIDAFVKDVRLIEDHQAKEAESAEGVTNNADKLANALPEMSKRILQSLESGSKAIPEIAAELKHPSEDVMYYLMSLRKYGFVKDTEEINEDEYYLYELKK
ncbi:MAG: CoB--CoM heterodisulfide reductase iron-sulfur subunit A family protein [Bacteroidales bacterium]|nr:CoB--CoM heterodisulfide reductase iron-sulfur subunit A family protein [Bacteroidales bacterium]